MDEGVKDANGCLKKPLSLVGSEKVEDRENGEEDNNSESNSLLPSRRGGLSRKSDKSKRKVQWNDNNGNKLAEVLVFDPSDVSDSDEEDSDSDSCICSIM